MKKLFFIILAFLGATSTVAAREALITKDTQLSVNFTHTDAVGHLIDNNVSTSLHSPQSGNLTEDCYIQIDLGEEKELGIDEDLVVYLQRCSDEGESHSHPTAFKVQRSIDGKDWLDWDDTNKSCHVYFLYRGQRTKEYSSRIHTSQKFRYLRFTVTANSGRKFDSDRHRYMGLAEFQIYKIGRDEDYSEILIDRFHLTTDYFTKYKDYTFVNKPGVLNELNRYSHGLDNWCDWKNWDSNGKWNKDLDKLAAAGIEMPDYTMITNNPNDPLGYTPDLNQERQPTHVTEHVLYAISGDAIALYPYYSFTNSTTYVDNYKVNFSHWYDYQDGDHLNTEDATTGAKVSMLDFLVDPSGIHKSDRYGFFAGTQLGKDGDEFVAGEPKFGSIATFFCPRSPYGEEGKLQNLPFRTGQDEFVIAADFSQSFAHDHHIVDNNKTIIEPVIQFRHIFRIRDGKDFADEFSSSKEKNEEYINLYYS